MATILRNERLGGKKNRCGCFGEYKNVLTLHIEVKVKVKFTLEQAKKIQRESRGIALLFL